MASTHEYIEYLLGTDDLPDLFCSELFIGEVDSVDAGTNTADITIGGTPYSSIPIFYHCWQSENVDGGYQAFGEGDSIFVLGRGTNKPGSVMNASTLTVVGFSDGSIKSCAEKFWMRLEINSNTLLMGGEQFFVRYQDASDNWHDTTTRGVWGKLDGTGDTDKYYLCGPYEFEYGWNGEDVQIHMHYLRGSGLDPGAFPTYMIDGEIKGGGASVNGYIFRYFIENDVDGDWRYGTEQLGIPDLGGSRAQSPQSQKYAHNMPPNCTTPAAYASDHVWARYCEFDLDMQPYDADAADTWVDDDGWSVSKKYQWGPRYDLVTSIYKTVTGAEWSTLMSNVEAQVYNWVTDEYEENVAVIEYDLEWELKTIKTRRPWRQQRQTQYVHSDRLFYYYELVRWPDGTTCVDEGFYKDEGGYYFININDIYNEEQPRVSFATALYSNPSLGDILFDLQTTNWDGSWDEEFIGSGFRMIELDTSAWDDFSILSGTTANVHLKRDTTTWSVGVGNHLSAQMVVPVDGDSVNKSGTDDDLMTDGDVLTDVVCTEYGSPCEYGMDDPGFKQFGGRTPAALNPSGDCCPYTITGAYGEQFGEVSFEGSDAIDDLNEVLDDYSATDTVFVITDMEEPDPNSISESFSMIMSYAQMVATSYKGSDCSGGKQGAWFDATITIPDQTLYWEFESDDLDEFFL